MSFTLKELQYILNNLYDSKKSNDQSIISKENAIKRVIFNEPATIILWEDGEKTVVKVQEGDKYDKRVGFLMCYLKRIVGNKTLLKEYDKWLSE